MADPAIMTDLADLGSLIEVQPGSTVSRTVLKAESTRVVLFAFDAGEELSEHTAAMPVMLMVIEGHLQITAAGRTVDLVPGGLLHLGTRLPHTVIAVVPSKLALLMIDPRSATT